MWLCRNMERSTNPLIRPIVKFKHKAEDAAASLEEHLLNHEKTSLSYERRHDRFSLKGDPFMSLPSGVPEEQDPSG